MNNKRFSVGIAVVASLAVVAAFFVFINPLLRISSRGHAAAAASAQGLIVQDEEIGTGEVASAGDTVTLNYVGRLQNGTVFDSTNGKQPFTFVLGVGHVIRGWDEGVQGMKIGGKRLLIIPPELAYGAAQYGPIPANSTLVFEVALLSVQHAGAQVTPKTP